MKIIRNHLIPFPGFAACNICGLVFVRKNIKVTETMKTHEAIHTAQMKELGYIGFYVIYLLEWLVNLFKYGFNKTAYYAISFEEEAYYNQDRAWYPYGRRHYAQWRKYRA